MSRRILFSWLVVAVMGALLVVLAYFTLRVENTKVQVLFAGLFALYALYVFLVGREKQVVIAQLFAAGLLLRVLLLFNTPNLSEDFFRFTWDGYLTTQGVDPYEYTPESYVSQFPEDTTARKLFEAESDGRQMNSKRYYSIYPTVNQLIFASAYWLTGSPNHGNIWLIKAFLLAFECLAFFLLLWLIRARGKKDYLVALYWMNPLVIVEFIGNIHFDGIALCFMLLSLYLLEKRRLVGSGLALAGAIATKLNPLLMACIGWRELGWKRWILWGAISGVAGLLLLAVFLDLHNIYHVRWSFRLYFYAFHFNSSSMNAIRGLFGPLAMERAMGFFPNIIFVGILSLNFLRAKWKMSERIILAFAIYYFLGTTIHPWYILTMIPFAILSGWWFPLVWSYLIVWTYSFYHVGSVEQIGWVVGLEYTILAVLVFTDIRRHWKS